QTMKYIEKWIEQLIISAGIAENVAVYLRLVILCILLILLAGISFLVCRKIISKFIYGFFKKTRVTWDEALADHKVLDHLAHIVPAIFVKILAPTIFRDFEEVLPFVIRVTDIYLIIVGFT